MESVGEAETGEGEAEQRGEQELTGTRTRSRDTVGETQPATAAITSLHRNISIRYRWYSAGQTWFLGAQQLYMSSCVFFCLFVFVSHPNHGNTRLTESQPNQTIHNQTRLILT